MAGSSANSPKKWRGVCAIRFNRPIKGGMDLGKHCIVRPGSKLRLKHRDPEDTFGCKRDDKAHEKSLNRLRELQHLLYADKRYSLLIVLQGLDAAGKDGT